MDRSNKKNFMAFVQLVICLIVYWRVHFPSSFPLCQSSQQSFAFSSYIGEIVSKLVGALSPVNHRRLQQGCTLERCITNNVELVRFIVSNVRWILIDHYQRYDGEFTITKGVLERFIITKDMLERFTISKGTLELFITTTGTLGKYIITKGMLESFNISKGTLEINTSLPKVNRTDSSFLKVGYIGKLPH